MKRKHKKVIFHLFDCMLIIAFSVYVLLDAFVIPQAYAVVETQSSDSASNDSTSSNLSSLVSNREDTSDSSTSAVITDTTYSDDQIAITITTYSYDDTEIYVADVQLSSIDYLKTAFANQTYGKNITATTSDIANSVNAILAINGDFYGAQNSGYVVRNGTVYRTNEKSDDQEDLVIKSDGSFEIIEEGDISESDLEDDDILQVLSFGPALIENGEIAVSESDEVGKAMASNPRTAIAEVSPLHYLFVVADGRTSESEGLSLYELAEFLETLGVTTAYNLDGGGSSTMVFNGTVINKPTTSGHSISERSVSDIVYIGYE